MNVFILYNNIIVNSLTPASMASPEKPLPPPTSQPNSKPVATPSPESAAQKAREAAEAKVFSFEEIRAHAKEINDQLYTTSAYGRRILREDLADATRVDLLKQSDETARKLAKLASIKNVSKALLEISSEGENLFIYDPVLHDERETVGVYEVRPDLSYNYY